MEKQPAIYIMASKPNGTLYIGVTSTLIQRAYQHKTNAVPGFTSKYHCHLLVYFELYNDISAAITREKQLKAGSRQKKLQLIETMNPQWNDLYFTIIV